MVFDAEKLLISNSCEIKWAIDNNSFKNKKCVQPKGLLFSFREGLVSHCPSGHALNPPLHVLLYCCLLGPQFYVLLVFVAMCSVFWLFWLSYQYLLSDWLERLL